jgi:acyl carrier protein
METVFRIIEDVLDLDRDSLRAGDDLIELGADSLDMVDIVLQLEDELEIDIDDDAIVDLKLHNTDNLIKYIDNCGK